MHVLRQASKQKQKTNHQKNKSNKEIKQGKPPKPTPPIHFRVPETANTFSSSVAVSGTSRVVQFTQSEDSNGGKLNCGLCCLCPR